MKNKMNIQRLGGLAALYCGLAYLLMIVYFLVIVDYPSITDQAVKIQMFMENQASMTTIYLFGYAVFGLVLVVLSVALYDKLKGSSENGAKISAIYAIIWACMLISTGMIYIRGINTVVDLYAIDPINAIAVWTGIEATAFGLSFVDGEIIGGLWTLMISVIAIKVSTFNKGVNYLGILVGVAGIASIIPAFNAAGGTGIFGIGQMVWYIWIGILLIKKGEQINE